MNVFRKLYHVAVKIIQKSGDLWHLVSVRMLLIILIWVFPLNLIGIALGNIAIKSVEERAKTSLIYSMNNYMEKTEQQMAEADYLVYSLLRSDSDAIIMDKQEGGYRYELSKNRFYNTFLKMFNIANVSDGSFYYLADQDDLLIWDKSMGRINRDQCEMFIRDKIIFSEYTGWFLQILEGENGEKNPVFFHVNRNPHACYGGMVNLSEAGREMQTEVPYGIESVTFTSAPQPQMSDSDLVVSVYWERAEIWFNAVLNRHDVAGSIERIWVIMRYCVIGALFLLPVFYFIIYKLLVIPLKAINKAHQALENGDPDYRITKKVGTKEYREAFISFNRMSERIKQLKIENYEKEISKKQIELKNLQLQIRPHFLLNMFNLIYNLSKANDACHIQQIILYLTDYFTYIFRSDKELELFGKELKVIEGYIQVAQIRYPGCIEFSCEYDPEVALVRIPPLLMHSFVENIVKHAVKFGTVTHISIIGQYDNKTVSFMIINDGEGIGPEQVKAVNEKLHKGNIDGKHVGMSNAYRRLLAFYGNGADIELESDPGIGTTVTVSFPYNLEVDES